MPTDRPHVPRLFQVAFALALPLTLGCGGSRPSERPLVTGAGPVADGDAANDAPEVAPVPTSATPPAGPTAPAAASPATPAAPAGDDAEALYRAKTDDLAYCVDETNRYRRTKGLPPLARAGDLERCAATAARADAKSRRPHGHFARTRGCGIAMAENELPWWKLSWNGGSVRSIMRKGIADMWAEGPGGGHHDNMAGDYTELGCGVYIDGDEVTVVQNFR